MTASPVGRAVYGMGSAAARLLGLRVRIPPEEELLPFVCVMRCQIEDAATSLSYVQRSRTDSGASLCVI